MHTGLIAEGNLRLELCDKFIPEGMRRSKWVRHLQSLHFGARVLYPQYTFTWTKVRTKVA